MSTLTSSDFGELKRPTTRVHAPPGGGSNWSIGGDDTPSTPVKKRGSGAPAAPVVQTPPRQEQHAVAPPPAPPAAGASPIKVATAIPARTAAVFNGNVFRIALIKTRADGEFVDAMLQNCVDKLRVNPSVAAETFVVSSVEDLPYAANKLSRVGGYDGVVAFGFLNATDPMCQAMFTCLSQSFIDIGVKTMKPVVRGVFVGEPRVASVPS